ncbi:MAG: hypothetical protein SX243_15770 [Acidobacteriota bacterium]|nr:hypothetical protein [Acidobacteriota bacterium]
MSVPVEEQDDDMIATFSIDLENTDLEGSSRSFALAIMPTKNGGHLLQKPVYKVIPLSEPLADSFRSDRVASELFLGSTYGLEYDENGDNSGFGQSELVGRLSIDYLWGRDKKWALHSGLRILSSSFVSELQPESEGDEPMAMASTAGLFGAQTDMDGMDDGEEEDSAPVDTVDSYSGSFYLHWQPGWLSPDRYSATGKDPERPYDAFRFGIFARVGFISRDSLTVTGDSTIMRWNVGLSLTHRQTHARSPWEDNTNGFPIGFIEFSYARYEEFGGMEDSGRFVADAGLRLANTGKGAVPFYVGVHLNAGKGPDDHRIFAGFLFELDRLAALVKN